MEDVRQNNRCWKKKKKTVETYIHVTLICDGLQNLFKMGDIKIHWKYIAKYTHLWWVYCIKRLLPRRKRRQNSEAAVSKSIKSMMFKIRSGKNAFGFESFVCVAQLHMLFTRVAYIVIGIVCWMHVYKIPRAVQYWKKKNWINVILVKIHVYKCVYGMLRRMYNPTFVLVVNRNRNWKETHAACVVIEMNKDRKYNQHKHTI